MGGVILIFLLGVAIVILVTPAIRARAQARRERLRDIAHEAVVRQLDDHRKRPRPKDDEAS